MNESAGDSVSRKWPSQCLFSLSIFRNSKRFSSEWSDILIHFLDFFAPSLYFTLTAHTSSIYSNLYLNNALLDLLYHSITPIVSSSSLKSDLKRPQFTLMFTWLVLPIFHQHASGVSIQSIPSGDGHNFQLYLSGTPITSDGIRSIVRTRTGSVALIGMENATIGDITIHTNISIIRGAALISFTCSSRSLQDETID
jgi:hypothetical protein